MWTAPEAAGRGDPPREKGDLLMYRDKRMVAWVALICGMLLAGAASAQDSEMTWENGLPDGAGNYGSQYDPSYPFYAEFADDFQFVTGTTDTYRLDTIEFSVGHFGHGGGCVAGGGGTCDDTPDDYTSIRVTVYADAGLPDGGPAGLPNDPADGGHSGGVVAEMNVLPGDYTWVVGAGLYSTVTMDVSGFEIDVDTDTPYWLAIAPETAYRPDGYQTGWINTTAVHDEPTRYVFAALGVSEFTELAPRVDLSFSVTGILSCAYGCDDAEYCTDDACVLSEGCVFTARYEPYGDIYPAVSDGVVDLQDITCVLEGFGAPAACPRGDFFPCGGGGDGIDLADIVAVLQSFAQEGPCDDVCPQVP